VEAARRAGVRKIALMSFLRARPHCGSAYHESKWAAEEIVRSSGLDYTIVKAGMVYGRGDHMLDHLSHSLHTVPLFATVGLHEKPIRPTMKVPLVARAQVRILSEGVVEPAVPCDSLPTDLMPTRRFAEDQIRRGLPEPGAFGLHDLQCSTSHGK